MIRVDKLVQKYGDFHAGDNISLMLARVEIFAFLGGPETAGRGKTTTIKMA